VPIRYTGSYHGITHGAGRGGVLTKKSNSKNQARLGKLGKHKTTTMADDSSMSETSQPPVVGDDTTITPPVTATTTIVEDPNDIVPKSQTTSPRPERTTFAAPKPTELQIMAAKLKGTTIEEAKFERRSGIDVMMALEGSSLHRLRRCFEDKQDTKGEGLDQQEFVDELLKLLKPLEKDKLNLVSDLIEVFEQIDINGDGSMEWAEFTAFCVEAGLLATHRIKVPLRYHYVENRRFQDTLTRGHVKSIEFIPETGQIGVADGAEPVLRFYDDNMKLAGLVDLRVATRIINETLSDDSSTFINPDDLKARVNTFCWVPTLELIVVASTDLVMTFWEEDPNYRGRYRYQGRAKTDTMINKIIFEQCTQLLFTVGGHELTKHNTAGKKQDRSGIITGWRLTFTSMPGSTKQSLGAESHCVLSGAHTTFVTDCISIPHLKYLITSSMDKKKNLCVWDMVEKKAKFTLQGHTRGCKQLAWAGDQRLLLSVGFEYEAYAWDVKTSRTPIMKLVGHRAPLMGIVTVNYTPLIRAITADIKGNFKMWDIRKSTYNTALCLQSWEPHDGNFTPLAMTANQNTREVLAGGYKLRRFECRRKSTATPIPRSVLYNSANLTFAVALDKEIQIYDGQTGLLVNTHYDICDSEVTTMCLDTRQRKLIVGTHRGECLVFSYMTGALMKRFNSHSSDITGISYCHGDKCVITTSWDRSVQVCDEEPMGSGSMKLCPTLRLIENAHKTDIVAVTFDHELSLYATASTDAIIKVYDFQFSIVEAPDIDSFNDNKIGHTAEITDISFVGGRIPALVTVDCVGIICIWAVRPSSSRGKLIHRLGNMDYIWDDSPVEENHEITKEGKEQDGDGGDMKDKLLETEKNGAATSKKQKKFLMTEIPETAEEKASRLEREKAEREKNEALVDPFHDARPIDKILILFANKRDRGPMLITADEEGYIGRWDLRPLLEMVDMITPVPWSKSPTRLASYSAHRRSIRNAANETSSLKSRPVIEKKNSGLSALRKLTLAQRMWSGYQEKINSKKVGRGEGGMPNHLQLASAVPRITRWKAHKGGINGLSFVDEAPYGLITCSIDMSTRIWSLTGKEIGMLTMSDLDKEKILQGRLKQTPWIFRPDVEYHIERGEKTAVNLIGAISKRKKREILQTKKDLRRKETLLASKQALEKELEAEFGSGGGSNAPKNPLREGLNNLQKIAIPVEKRVLLNKMLGKVASLTRNKKSPRADSDSDSGGENDENIGGKPETKEESSFTGPPNVLPALRPYEHYDYEISKVKNKSAAILEIPVDCTPSPFLQRHMPKGWQQTTASERLDKKNKDLLEQSISRRKGVTQSVQEQPISTLTPAASAPSLGSSSAGVSGLDTNVRRKISLPALGGKKGSVNLMGIDVSNSARVRGENALRKRMNAKIKAFENVISEVQDNEAKEEELEKQRIARKPKERKSLYANYDDIDFDDVEGSENIHQSKRAGHTEGKITNFGSYGIKEVLELRKLFNSIDEDASGSIDVEEFVNSPALKSTHMFVNAESMFGSIDRDESGTISFGELLAVAFPQASRKNLNKMLKFVKDHESQEHMKEKISLNTEQMSEINEIFKLYDVDASGGISTEELYEAMVGANPAMQEIFSLEDMDKLVRQYDADGNATLELAEFTKLFKENFMEDIAQDATNIRSQAKRSSLRSH
jgi:WD40 repeat protein/Ca2+-binding EF-hand superfamily protein